MSINIEIDPYEGCITYEMMLAMQDDALRRELCSSPEGVPEPDTEGDEDGS